MRMTAAVMYEQGLPRPFAQSKPFVIQDVELDGPGPGEVLIEIRGAGLCHSDLSTLEGMRKRPLPVVGGHEGAGIVREVGAGVAGFKPGDHVAMAAVAGCGQCRVCRAGRPGLCKVVAGARSEGMLATGHRRLRLPDGGRLNHYSGVSVYAQYSVTTPAALIRIDPAVPLDLAALFGCAVVTGAGAVFNSARVRPGSSVAVIGLGGVGLASVMAAREAGAAVIIGVDVLPSKFDLARACGATHCINPLDPDGIQRLLDLTDGGVDYSFEVSGNLAAMATAEQITIRGGEVVGVGVGRSDATFSTNHLAWVSNERVLRGSFMGGGVPQQDIPRYVDLFLGGRLPVDKLKSEQISFDQLNDGFDRLHAGTVIRQVLLPHGTV
jgi:Zn-dependent alcohol dehydrogenase